MWLGAGVLGAAGDAVVTTEAVTGLLAHVAVVGVRVVTRDRRMTGGRGGGRDTRPHHAVVGPVGPPGGRGHVSVGGAPAVGAHLAVGVAVHVAVVTRDQGQGSARAAVLLDGQRDVEHGVRLAIPVLRTSLVHVAEPDLRSGLVLRQSSWQFSFNTTFNMFQIIF